MPQPQAVEEGIGFAVVEPEKIEAKLNTIYDLASLTKVLVTGFKYLKTVEFSLMIIAN